MEIDFFLSLFLQVAFGTDFSKLWTPESLGIKVPEGNKLNVFNYTINASLQALQLSFNSIYPPLNQVCSQQYS